MKAGDPRIFFISSASCFEWSFTSDRPKSAILMVVRSWLTRMFSGFKSLQTQDDGWMDGWMVKMSKGKSNRASCWQKSTMVEPVNNHWSQRVKPRHSFGGLFQHFQLGEQIEVFPFELMKAFVHKLGYNHQLSGFGARAQKQKQIRMANGSTEKRKMQKCKP